MTVAKILNLFRWRRDRLDRDLERELKYHMDRRVDDLMKSGVNETEARRRASIEFGGVAQVQEEVRETWTWRWLDALVADVRYSIRGLAKRWSFSLGIVAVLALGIGATVAIFSVINTVLLQPLAYPDAERIVSVETLWTNTGRISQDVSGPDFLDWQAQNDVFETMAVSNGGDNDGDLSATIVGDRAVFANARYVSAEFFAVFGQMALAGRLLTEHDVPTDDAMPTVAVAAHHWAVAHFGSADAAIGRKISVYSTPLEIVGVAAPGFRYPGAADLWAPSTTSDENRGHHTYRAVGKLASGVDLTRAQAQIQTIGANLARAYPENRLKSVTLIPLQERLTGDVQVMLWVLMGAVFAVMLIACANVSNLLLARAAVRIREIALRAALGAGRRRLMRQLLTESGVLGALAGATGLALAFILIRGLVLLSPANLPRLEDVRVDMTVLLFALGLSLVSTVLFGLVPALHVSRFDVSDALKQGGSKATVSRARSRIRSALVVTEVALSVTLLAAAGLLLRSFQTLQDVDLGFTTNRVLVAYTDYAVNDEREILIRSRVYADLLDRLRAVPGVSAAAGIAFLPMGREHRAARDYFVQGHPEGRPGERPQAELYAITPEYFKTLEIPLRAGRDFDRTDTPDRPRVAIINETLARNAFPGESPLGRHIRTNSSTPWMEIVGVVGDTRWQNPSQPPPSALFVSSLQGLGKSLSILARTSLEATSLAGTIRRLLYDANPTVPVKFETMGELHDFALAHPRFRTRVIGLFAGVSALLAAVGIFSVLAYLVGQRTRELAVRRALGAPTSDVIRLIVGQGMRLVAIGLALGLAGALAVARLLEGLLYEISPWDVGSYVGALVVIAVAALLAALIPAIRAATIAPLIALQQE
jgi:putative ABC transport system permease protein